ncbi:MAG: SDR family oxidoreductase [Fibromonadales bacterium]|nr:SDR family oxidoreductase [Fibromonadales bacterium]
MKVFRNAVILGGTGFIGRHLKQHLENSGIKEIHIADLPDIDVRTSFDVPGTFGEDTLLVNLAAIHRTPGHPDEDYFKTNIPGAENCCGFAKKNGIKNIVFMSSISIYGTSESLKTEETLPMPNTPYGISKLMAERIHREWAAESDGRFLTILRPGIVFGKGENGNMTRLYRALKQRRFAYAGRKDTVKASIYVKDLARISLESAQKPKERVQLYNCTYFPAPTIEHVAQTMKTATGLNRSIPYIPKIPLMATASIAGMLGGFGFGICPERVRKLMVSTNISGEKLNENYPLKYSLKDAFADWFKDCEKRGLE